MEGADRFNHTAVYPGTFDPVTLGHLDVIRRGSRLFDRLVVAVGQNPEKKPLFTAEERLELLAECVQDLANVEVCRFDGLVVDFLHQMGAHILLRGVRTLSDMEYEFTMVLTNQALAPDIETVFLMASQEYSFVHANMIKKIAELGGDIGKFVPPNVCAAVLRKVKGQNR